jgi:hypothetical protein
MTRSIETLQLNSAANPDNVTPAQAAIDAADA